jgi:prepilin-type processing-associated H-X9-DG protein
MTTPAPFGQPVIDVFKRHKINGGGDTISQDIFTLQMTAANSPDLARPSSAHVDGVNVGFADGATRFVAVSIDYRVYQAIMTPRGKSSNVPWPEFVLTDQLGE